MEGGAAQSLRSLVHDCLAKHMYDAAAFYADKMVSLSGYSPAEVYTLAQAFYCARQFRRCLQLLRGTELIEKDVRFRFLAARCLVECKEWEECLAVLGGLDAEDPAALAATLPMPRGSDARAPGTAINYFSAVCLLRGRVHDAQDNFPRAITWYRAALRADPFNVEAFQALVGGHKLSNAEELELVRSLDIPQQQGWLRDLYLARCKKYEQTHSIEGTLAALEGETPAQQPQRQPHQQAAATAVQTPGGAAYQQQQAQQAQQGPQPMALSPLPEERAAGGGEQPPAAAPGWGLHDNLDVLACRAEWLYHRGAYAECYALTSAALERDPYATECLPVHLASALELKKKTELFARGHKLVEEHPDRAVSWFAVGCYYMCSQQYEQARRYFGKATALDRGFAPAWVAFGHAFAAQDESDQAMAAYRTANRLFPGLHGPLMGMGMEYQRMNNQGLAEQCFSQAAKLCPSDPLAANELGVLAYRSRDYEGAARWLRQALEQLPGGRPTAGWEPTLVNLGHTLRKLRQWDAAIDCYRQALGLKPGQPGTYSALGYTFHLMGDFNAAIEHYHKALGLRPEDVFTAEMLAEAMEEASVAFESDLRRDGSPGPGAAPMASHLGFVPT
ncbi:hypothetical protein ABPG77_003192 [Micractinium sp. CCAP 211/92]